MILSNREVIILYDFIQWQHLPYNNPELQALVRRMRTEVDIILAKEAVKLEIPNEDPKGNS